MKQTLLTLSLVFLATFATAQAPQVFTKAEIDALKSERVSVGIAYAGGLLIAMGGTFSTMGMLDQLTFMTKPLTVTPEGVAKVQVFLLMGSALVASGGVMVALGDLLRFWSLNDQIKAAEELDAK